MSWLKGIRTTRAGFYIEQTGHCVPFTKDTFVDISRWIEFYSVLRFRKPVRKDLPSVMFYPHTPKPWYFPWAIAWMLGVKFVTRPQDADLIWYFEDATQTSGKPTNDARGLSLNQACTDVSKSLIADAFQSVFGYNLAVDPDTHEGPMVEKSEINGAHDGRIVQGPTTAKPGCVYQHVVDNRIDGEFVEDLRTTIMGGRPVLVFRKQRAESERFVNCNRRVLLSKLDDVFTSSEQGQIAQFANEIGLEAGGLDVLRDKTTNRLFIVDANKTDMGPPLALPLKKKLEATRLMAEALDRYLLAGTTLPSSHPHSNASINSRKGAVTAS